MRPDDAPLSEEERLERDRLRGGEREVEPRPVLVLAAALAAKANAGAPHVPREHLLEARRVHVPPKAKRRRRAPVPEARPAVLRIVPRVVPVALEVVHRLTARPRAR